jgi:hypothetical protein
MPWTSTRLHLWCKHDNHRERRDSYLQWHLNKWTRYGTASKKLNTGLVGSIPWQLLTPRYSYITVCERNFETLNSNFLKSPALIFFLLTQRQSKSWEILQTFCKTSAHSNVRYEMEVNIQPYAYQALLLPMAYLRVDPSYTTNKILQSAGSPFTE